MGDSGRVKPRLGNIPLWNLREEFHLFRQTLALENFRSALLSQKRPIATPILDWHGSPNDLLTLVVQRAVQGLEAYICGAVWAELGASGRLTPQLNQWVRNPFKIPGRGGTASQYYHRLPCLLSPDLSLTRRMAVWCEVVVFYKNVRNPIFHGLQLQSRDLHEARECLELIQRIYDWIDSWHALERPFPQKNLVLCMQPG